MRVNMTNPIENIKEEVSRLEDLIRLSIDQVKEQQKQCTDFSLDRLSAINKQEKRVLGFIGVAITVLLGLTQLPTLKNNDLNSVPILFEIITSILILFAMLFAFFSIF